MFNFIMDVYILYTSLFYRYISQSIYKSPVSGTYIHVYNSIYVPACMNDRHEWSEHFDYAWKNKARALYIQYYNFQ